MEPERFSDEPVNHLTTDTVPIDARELRALLGDFSSRNGATPPGL